ncbi:MAG: ABC-type transport system involved in multi-copper enzyme maturation, permease component, partial [uncultured Blastococcus sp.]
DRADHRRPHPARSLPPAGRLGAAGPDGRAAGAQRLGLLPADRPGHRAGHDDQRRGAPGGLRAAQPDHVRVQPDRGDRHGVPRRPHGRRRGGVGAGAGHPRPPGPPLGRAARQVARAGHLRRRLRGAGRPRPAAGRARGGRLLAAVTRRRARAAGRPDRGAADAGAAALQRHLPHGFRHRRRRAVRRDVGRRRRRRDRRRPGQRRRRARGDRLPDRPADRRPVAGRHERLPGPLRTGADGAGRGRVPVPERGTAGAGLPDLGRAVDRGHLGADRAVLPAPRHL